MKPKALTAKDLAARLAARLSETPRLRLSKISASLLAAGLISLGVPPQEAHADVGVADTGAFANGEEAYNSGFGLGYSSAMNGSTAVWGGEASQYAGTYAEGVNDGIAAAQAAMDAMNAENAENEDTSEEDACANCGDCGSCGSCGSCGGCGGCGCG